jgi:quinolinate synthase
VVAAADFAGSTSAMIRFVEAGTARRYLLLTESAMADNIRAARPDKELLRLCPVRCPHMNRITLENTYLALRDTRHVIEVPEPVRARAARAVERMIAIG